MSKRRGGRRRRRSPSAEPAAAPTGILRLLSELPAETLDLHGYDVLQAQVRVRNFLATHGRISSGKVVQIITGKSTGVLLEAVRDMLEGEAADLVDEYAGLHGGGGWVVRMR